MLLALTGTQIVVAGIWAALLLLLAYLIRDSYRKGHEKVTLALIPIFAPVCGLFIVYAAKLFGIDLDEIKDLFDGDDDNGGTTTNGDGDG